MASGKHITLDQKVEIIKLIENSYNYDMISEKYKISKSTVGDTKKIF